MNEQEENLDDEEHQKMIKRADLDNDGLVCVEDFYAIMTQKGGKLRYFGRFIFGWGIQVMGCEVLEMSYG